MGQRVLVELGTAAVEDPGDGVFRILSSVHKDCKPIIAIDGLSDGEEVCLWFYTGFGFVPVEANSNDGTQVKFTSDYAADIFNGAGVFGVTKPSTANAITVVIEDGRL